MTVSSLIAQLTSGRPAVDENGRFSREVEFALAELVRDLNTNVTQTNTDITTASGAATVARESVIVGVGDPPSMFWSTDTSGTFPAGDPTRDLTMNFKDSDGDIVATRVLRGTLTSSSGNIAVTAVSITEVTGYSTTYTVADSGTASARADIVLTTPSATKVTASLSWNAIDVSSGSTTPVSGGDKA